jgi:hypothetical protein
MRGRVAPRRETRKSMIEPARVSAPQAAAIVV